MASDDWANWFDTLPTGAQDEIVRLTAENAALRARAEAAEAERVALREKVGAIARWIIDDLPCFCAVPPVPSDSHEDVCREMRVLLAAAARPDQRAASGISDFDDPSRLTE